MPRRRFCLDRGRSGQARHLPAKVLGRDKRRQREATGPWDRRRAPGQRLPKRFHRTPMSGIRATTAATNTACLQASCEWSQPGSNR
jgi:hypothetical protein